MERRNISRRQFNKGAVATTAAVATIRAAVLDVFLAPERCGTISAFSGSNRDQRFINKFHRAILTCRSEFIRDRFFLDLYSRINSLLRKTPASAGVFENFVANRFSTVVYFLSAGQSLSNNTLLMKPQG